MGMDDASLLRIRTRQLESSREHWCRAAERALEAIPGASLSTHPAYDLWLRVRLHRAPPVELVQSDELAHCDQIQDL